MLESEKARNGVRASRLTTSTCFSHSSSHQTPRTQGTARKKNIAKHPSGAFSKPLTMPTWATKTKHHRMVPRPSTSDTMQVHNQSKEPYNQVHAPCVDVSNRDREPTHQIRTNQHSLTSKLALPAFLRDKERACMLPTSKSFKTKQRDASIV